MYLSSNVVSPDSDEALIVGKVLELRILAEKAQGGSTVLLQAAYRGELKVVQWLLKTGEAVITEKDNNGETALLKAASQGHLVLVQWLLQTTWLQKGWALITEKDNNGETALLKAASRGYLELVQWLLQTGGADITERDNSGNTALLCAANGGHLEVVQWLLQTTWLQKSWALITEKDNHGRTALLNAASRGHRDLVWWLLHKGGAVITQRDSCNKTALHWAIWGGHINVVQLLLAQGVDKTVLQEAAECGRIEIVQWLLMETNYIFSKEEMDCTREVLRKSNNYSLGLWLDFYIFLSANPSLPLTQCLPLAYIFGWTGNDKALLLDKSLVLLFSLFEEPKNKTLGQMLYQLLPSPLRYQNHKRFLGLTIYQLYEHQFKPLISKKQQEIIKRLLEETNNTRTFELMSQGTNLIINSVSGLQLLNTTSNDSVDGLWYREVRPVLNKTLQEPIKQVLDEDNTNHNTPKDLLQLAASDCATIEKPNKEQQIAQKNQILVEGFYSGEDIDILIKALLKKQHLVIAKDFSVSVKKGKDHRVDDLRTYVLPATSKNEGLGHLEQLIGFLAAGQVQACQILIPYKVSIQAHWVSVFIHYQDKQFIVTVYDSLANKSLAAETINEIVKFTKSKTKEKIVIIPLQNPKQIQNGNVYCGGYTAHIIAGAAINSPKNLSEINELTCIKKFYKSTKKESDYREMDAKIVATQKPKGYQRYAIKGDGHQTPEIKALSELQEKEAHHRYAEELTRRFKMLSQENLTLLAEKLHNEITIFVHKLTTENSHKAAIEILFNYRNYCTEELKLSNDENPFAIFFKQQENLQSLEIDEAITSLDIFIKEKLLTLCLEPSKSRLSIEPYQQTVAPKDLINSNTLAEPTKEKVNEEHLTLTATCDLPEPVNSIENTKVMSQVKSEDCLHSKQEMAQMLRKAATNGELDSVQQLLQAGGADIYGKDKSGYTPLLLSASRGRCAVVHWLLEEGWAKITEKDNYNNTALLLAARSGKLEMVQLLLRLGGADIYVMVNANYGSAFELAVMEGHLGLVQWLIQEGWERINRMDGKGNTPLLLAANWGKLELAQWLLKKGGASITEKNYFDDCTALLGAARSGVLKLVKWLLRDGKASITERDYYGRTALLLAAKYGKLWVVKWVLQKGGAAITEVDNDGNTALMLAAEDGCSELVEWLLREGRATITNKNREGNTALLVAAKNGHCELVQLLLREGWPTVTEKNREVNKALLLAAKGNHLELVQWLLIISDFVFSKEEVDRVRGFAQRHLNPHCALNLWLEFYSFLQGNPSQALTESKSLHQILAFKGKEKELLLDKTLILVFSLFESPQHKALVLALYHLYEQELQPLLSKSQRELIEHASLAKADNEQQLTNSQALVLVVEDDLNESIYSESKQKIFKIPQLLKLGEDEKHLLKLVLKQIPTPDLFSFALSEAFSDKYTTDDRKVLSLQDETLLPEQFSVRIKKAFATLSDKSLYKRVMFETCIMMYKKVYDCQPSFLPSFLDKITVELRGDTNSTLFQNKLHHWREHPNPTADRLASLFQKALETHLEQKYKLLFEFPKLETKENPCHSNIYARESIKENVLNLFKKRAPSVVQSWLTERGLKDLKNLDPLLALNAFSFSKRREAFVEKHPCGPDDNKVPSYYQKVIEQYGFNQIASTKFAFIVVAHFVHTLPYFLEALSSLGEVAAVISKQSSTVKTVRKSILDIYKDIIVSTLDKKNLTENPTAAESFFGKLFENEKWKDYRFIILDHGGYFASRINDILKKYKNKIVGVVEHTWNGEVRYQEQLKHYHSIPFPVLSVAHSTLKGLESEAVANSIVDALTGKIFTGEGVSQTIYTLKQILVIGYGNIGKAVAIALKNRLGNRSKEVICICDISDYSIREAKRDFSRVTQDKTVYLREADLIITATSTKVLSKKDFLKLKAGAFIACATSSDDQFTTEALKDHLKQEGPTKQVQSLCPKYKHKHSENYFYLIANGDSVNFTIGSTPHPIIHIVLTSIVLDAYQLIQNNLVWNLNQINVYNGYDLLIKKTYEQVFGTIDAKNHSLSNRIQEQSIALIEKMDQLKPHKNYLKLYVPVPLKITNHKHGDSDALIPLVFQNETLQNLLFWSAYGLGKTFLLHYFLRLWHHNLELRQQLPYVFYIKLSVFKDALFKQYNFNSTELKDLTQVLLLLKGIQESRTVSPKVIIDSSSWYEEFAYELAENSQRFALFIDWDIALTEMSSYKIIRQIIGQLLKGQPQCRIVMATNTRLLVNQCLEVQLLPWSLELLKRSQLVNPHLLIWLERYSLLKSVVHNLKILKKQFKLMSTNKQLTLDNLSLIQQTQLLEEIQWTQYAQSKHALENIRDSLNDLWQRLYKKHQDHFNEKSLSIIRSHFADEFKFSKQLAYTMMDKRVSYLSQEDCEAVWQEVKKVKKLKDAKQLLKHQSQMECALQTLQRAGFLFVDYRNNCVNYQFGNDWLPYFYAVGWVGKYGNSEKKKNITQLTVSIDYAEAVQSYVTGLLSQKKADSKLLVEFTTADTILSLPKLKTEPDKKIIKLPRIDFFHNSSEKVNKAMRSTSNFIANNDENFSQESDNKTNKNSNKKTKHGSHREILFQPTNNKKEEQKYKLNKKDENLNAILK